MIIFLYGADTFRSRRFLQELKNKFIRQVDPGALSLDVLNGQTIKLKDLSEKINTGSLFVQKRLISIENIFKNPNEKIFTELLSYLKKFAKDESKIIIFREAELGSKNKTLKVRAKKLFTFLAQQDYSQEFSLLNNSQLLSFIKKEAKTYDKEIGLTAATLLINLTTGDLWRIAKEVRKLAFYTKEKVIKAVEVKEMVAGTYDENIFKLTDALSNKNRKLAIGLLEEQYAAGLSQEYLIVMLIRQFKILLQIQQALEQNLPASKIASQLRLHPFVVKKGIIQAKNFTETILKKYLNHLIRLDFLNKTGRANVKIELSLLISQL